MKKETPRLVTSRLLLRPFLEGDAPSIYKWCSSLRVTEYLFWYPHKDLSVSERLLKTWLRKKRNLSWGVVIDNDLFGEVEVIKDIKPDSCEVGYTFREDMWGKGYASESLRKVIAYLFVYCGYRSIYAETDSRNERSGHLLNKLGFYLIESDIPFHVAKKNEDVKLNRYELRADGFVASLKNEKMVSFIDALGYEATKYPCLKSQDIIKMAYQNAYGGEHLINDEAKAKEYLKEEMEAIDSSSSDDMTSPVGDGLVRLDLGMAKKMGLSLDEVWRLFFYSLAKKESGDVTFKKNLESVEALLKKGDIGKVDSSSFSSYLKTYKEGPVHHSESYRLLYKPGYRLVNEALLALVLPLPSYQ